eukprot:2438365-Rhodomonas_salina.1
MYSSSSESFSSESLSVSRSPRLPCPLGSLRFGLPRAAVPLTPFLSSLLGDVDTGGGPGHLLPHWHCDTQSGRTPLAKRIKWSLHLQANFFVSFSSEKPQQEDNEMFDDLHNLCQEKPNPHDGKSIVQGLSTLIAEKMPFSLRIRRARSSESQCQSSRMQQLKGWVEARTIWHRKSRKSAVGEAKIRSW